MGSLWEILPAEIIERIESYLTYNKPKPPDYLFEIEALKVPAFTYYHWSLFAPMYDKVPKFREYVRSRVPLEVFANGKHGTTEEQIASEKTAVFTHMMKDDELKKIIIDVCKTQVRLKSHRWRVEDPTGSVLRRIYQRPGV